jgi:hypothetical protein
MTTLKGDARYSLRKEFTGDFHDYSGLMAGQMWVVRFCGEFVAAVSSKPAGLQIVAAHQSKRQSELMKGDDRFLPASR